MIWNRERYIAHSLFEDTGREMFCEIFGPLHVLEKEWRSGRDRVRDFYEGV